MTLLTKNLRVPVKEEELKVVILVIRFYPELVHDMDVTPDMGVHTAPLGKTTVGGNVTYKISPFITGTTGIVKVMV